MYSLIYQGVLTIMIVTFCGKVQNRATLRPYFQSLIWGQIQWELQGKPIGRILYARFPWRAIIPLVAPLLA